MFPVIFDRNESINPPLEPMEQELNKLAHVKANPINTPESIINTCKSRDKGQKLFPCYYTV